MKAKIITMFVLCVIVNACIPFVSLNLSTPDASLFVCLMLFFAINPAFSLVLGAVSGSNVKCMWWLPLLNSVMFVIFSWILFGLADGAFFIYGGIYLVFGIISMAVSSIIHKFLSK